MVGAEEWHRGEGVSVRNVAEAEPPVAAPAVEEAPKATSTKKKRRVEAVDDEPEEEPAPAPKAAKASKTAVTAAGEGAPKKKKVLKVKAGVKGKL